VEAILSFQTTNISITSRSIGEASVDDRSDGHKSDEAQKTRVARRGACQAFQQLSGKFGVKLLDVIPNLWQSIVGGLLSACQSRK
jgi:TATA-binding protein-associated factor